MKKRRVTVVLEEKVHNKLRQLQAKEINKSNKTVSFSKIINDTIRKEL